MRQREEKMTWIFFILFNAEFNSVDYCDRNYIKIRLLMLYIIGKDGVKDEDRRQLVDHANISSEEIQAITNLALLGIQLSRSTKSPSKSPSKTNKKKKIGDREDDVSFELSRYSPYLKTVMQELVGGGLSRETFPFIKEPSIGGVYGASAMKQRSATSSSTQPAAVVPTPSAAGATSLRSTKPSWHTKKTEAVVLDKTPAVEERRRGGKVIVFVVGGVTYSEIRCMYELSAAHKKDFIIGKLHCI
jgi:syntaxin-binding protein 1